MLEDVLQNRHVMLGCIQYEVLQKKSVLEAYKNFCKTLGDDVMNFKEFDFWYYYFLNGNFDLDHDRSKDPKTHEFSDFPMDVVKKIVEKLEWKEKCIFGNVSKKCRQIVDQQPVIINQVKMITNEKTIKFSADGQEFTWKIDQIIDVLKAANGKARRTVWGDVKGPVQKSLFTDFLTALHNSNVQIKQLNYKVNDQYLRQELCDFLKSLNHQIHVESFEFDTYFKPNYRGRYFDMEDELQDELMLILPFLKPGALESIKLEYHAEMDLELEIDKIVKLDQWKQAKHLTANFLIWKPIEDLVHFNRLDISVYWSNTPENVIRLKDIYMSSPNFERAVLNGKFDNKKVLKIRELRGDNDRFLLADGSTLRMSVGESVIIFEREFVK